jgi:hypothetical protein
MGGPSETGYFKETALLRGFGEMKDPQDAFVRRVRTAAAGVLGDSDVGRVVMSLCDNHAEARLSVVRDRTPGAVPIAFIGPTGQGKSWLLRQLIRSPRVRGSIPSGNQLDEATEKLLWVGSAPPADLDYRHEVFVYCDAQDQVALGFPYVLVDTPGSTDERSAIAAIARKALSLAAVLILVVRRDQMRSGTLGDMAMLSEGSIVVPVINSVREHDANLPADVDEYVARIRQAAPTTILAPAIVVDDFAIGARSEAEVAAKLVGELSDTIRGAIDRTGGPESRQASRLGALDARFRTQVAGVLGDRLPGLTRAVDRLRETAEALPIEIAQSLVGGGPGLRAAIRSRLRANLLADTSAIWFPYRSVLGLLSLTNGAWDRLVLSLTGSLPSLISTAWTGVKNLVNESGEAFQLRDSLRQRAAAIVSQRLGPPTARFHAELKRLRGSAATAGDRDIRDDDVLLGDDALGVPERVAADLAGIDALQEASREIVETQIDRVAVSKGGGLACCVLGTLAFWGLMAGPIIALYRSYFDASFSALRDLGGDLSAFPRPDFSLILTSLLLSLLPTAVFAMFVMTWAQSRRRVDQAEADITQSHRAAIQKLQRDRVLRLRWNDPLLADAEFLLAIDRDSRRPARETVLK